MKPPLLALVTVLLVVIFYAVAQPLRDSSALSVFPHAPVSGDPVLVVIDVPGGIDAVRNVSLGSTTLPVFSYGGRTAALYGIDLEAKAGTYPIDVLLTGGRELRAAVTVAGREQRTVLFTIPAKLGGNTAASERRLAVELARENAALKTMPTESRALWTAPFIIPLASTTVTDVFGYTRMTGAYGIVHKGVDFRAATGTPVLASNRGIVRVARAYSVYGNTIVLDHGEGLETLYLHLSKFAVSEGETVERGEVIGFSGDTGYAARPHLHFSVRINGVSVDPLTFLSFFK